MSDSRLDSILSHWSKLFEDFSTDAYAFYDAVEAGLARRKLPEGKTRMVQWSEGGVFAPDREYLRIEGGGFRFDLCAAPYGTGYFFSWWLTPKPAQYVLLWLALFLLGSWQISRFVAKGAWSFFQAAPATDWMIVVLRFLFQNPFTVGGVSLVACMGVVSLLARAGLREPEDALVTIPILGWVHERIFAPVTLYRLDTAILFRTSVHQAVLEAIDALTAEKGVRALAPEERKPTLDRLG